MDMTWEFTGAFLALIGTLVALLVLQTMWITHLFSQLRSDFRQLRSDFHSHTHPDHGTVMRIERLEKRVDDLERRAS